MLHLWEKFERRYPRTPGNVDAVIRGREYWTAQLEQNEEVDLLVERLDIELAFFAPDFTVGVECCAGDLCGKGKISIPLQAFLVDKQK